MNRKKLPILAVFFMFLIVLFIAHPKAASNSSIRIATQYDGKVSSAYQTNCVKFTRRLVPSLPYGLTYLQNKKNIINSQNPVVGAVAIVKTSNAYGHVAYVSKVSGSTITTIDANWYYQGKRRIVYRTGSASSLGIVGYYVPKNIKQEPNKVIEQPSHSRPQAYAVKPSIRLASSRNYSTKTGVALYSLVKKNKTDKVSAAGLYLWPKGSKKPSTPYTKETFSKGFTSQTSVSIYYRPGIAFGKGLKSKTTYNYQIYAVVNGKTIITGTGSMTTK